MSAVDTDKTAVIVRAVLDELGRVGYGRTSMEAVARRAAVGKSALYRRWASKEEMVVSALAEMSLPSTATLPDTGSLRGDLVAALRGFVGWLTDPRLATVLPDLAAEAKRNAVFARSYQAQIALPRRAAGAAIFRRAVDRGELDAGTDVELAVDLISAPLYWRLNIRHLQVPPGYVDRLVDHVLRALGAAPGATSVVES